MSVHRKNDETTEESLTAIEIADLKAVRRKFDALNQQLLQETRDDVKTILKGMNDWKFQCLGCSKEFDERLRIIEDRHMDEEEQKRKKDEQNRPKTGAGLLIDKIKKAIPFLGPLVKGTFYAIIIVLFIGDALNIKTISDMKDKLIKIEQKIYQSNSNP